LTHQSYSMITKNFIFLLLATFFFQREMVYAQKPKQDELKDSLSSVLSNIKNDNPNSIETRKRQIDNFENQNKISELSKDNQLNKILLFSALGAFLSSIYIAYLFLKNSNRKKVLAQQKQAIEEQKVLTLIKNQEMQVINACVSGQEQERQSISEELHDNIGSDMATLKMHIENLLNQPTTPNTKEILHKLESIVDQSYQKIRNLSHLKSNTLVAQKGLELALEKLLNNINSNDQTLVKIELFGFDKDMKDESKVLIYNTLQELISNAIKHAKATQINAQITNFDHEFNILVEDNGSGFDYSDKILEKGMGLYNLKRKIEHLGGTFLVDSFKGKGTTINIDIPI
jgi:signal transduction histidine kinase